MGLFALWLTTAPTAAHEFWIEPQGFTLPAGGVFQPQVRVGEHLGGRTFPLDAGGYETVLWVGPGQSKMLAGQGLAGKLPVLHAMGEGLHVLAVASYPQTHVYETEAEFRDFVAEIRAESALANLPANAKGGTLEESYRRFSKTLVHFGEEKGEDKRIGLAREWVKSGESFTLLFDSAPVPHQPVTLLCRTAHSGHDHVTEIELTTDAEGTVNPDLPHASTCLLNTVFLQKSNKGQWSSDWVSMFWQT